VIHYAAPNGLIYPFCAYNSGPTYSMPFEKQLDALGLADNANDSLVTLG